MFPFRGSLGLVALVLCLSLSSGSVLELSGDHTSLNFLEGTWLLKFCVTECTHSQTLAPVWEELGQFYGRYFQVVKIDCLKESELCAEQNIDSYPTIKLFHNGEEHLYTGRRQKDEIVSFVSEKTGFDINDKKEALKILRAQNELKVKGTIFETVTEENIEEVRRKDDWFLVFESYPCEKCGEFLSVLEEVSKHENLDPPEGKFHFGRVDCSTEKSLCSSFGIFNPPYPKLRYVHLEFVFHYTGEWNAQEVLKFLDLYYQTWHYPRLVEEEIPEEEASEEKIVKDEL